MKTIVINMDGENYNIDLNELEFNNGLAIYSIKKKSWRYNEEIEETLEAIGRKRGCLVRGGIVDYDKVYSVVINDIKTGIIKGITFDRYE